MLRRSPGFAAAVIVTLALGLGTNAAMFAFLNDLFLREPQGVPAAAALRRVWLEERVGISREPYFANAISYHGYRALVSALRGRAELALYRTQRDVAIGRGEAVTPATVAYATASYFATLRIQPAVGRWFTEGEADVHGAQPVAVIGDGFWRTRFGGDRSVIGRSVTIDGRDYTVIGVARPGLTGLDLDETQVWLPLGTYPTRDVARVSFWESSVITFAVFARVRPAQDDGGLERDATAAYQRAPVTDFAPDPADRIRVAPILDARGPGPRPREASIGLRLSIVAVILLLITVANVLNLLLARSLNRRREIAIRAALGISRARLTRLVIVECLMLSFAAGLAAILSVKMTGNILRGQLLPGTHFATGPVSGLVVLFTALLSCATGLVVGALTVVNVSRPDLTAALRAGSPETARGRRGVSQSLVGVQAALAVTLLVAAVLLVVSLMNIERLRIGFDVDRLADASVALPSGERPDTASFSVTMRAAGERLRSVPGVEAIAFAWNEPIGVFGRVKLYTASDSSEKPGMPLPTASYVSGDYFRAIGLRVIRGRALTDDATSSTAVVVNTVLARMFWPTGDAVGQCVHLQSKTEPCLHVAGVVENSVRQQLTEEPGPQIYLPIFGSVRGQRPPVVLIVRAAPDRLSAVMLRASLILHDMFPRGTPSVTKMSDRIEPMVRPWRLGAVLFATFGALSLLVAALGMYSSVSYSVTQRTREFGVRIALGATTRDVIQLVMRRALTPVLIGSIVGIALGLALARIVRTFLYGVSAGNPLALVSASLVLLTSAALAAALPAWRAARVDPVRTMAVD